MSVVPGGTDTAAPSGARAPGLVLRGVTAFHGSAQALHGIDLDVAPGEAVALLGRNGMGKTTTIGTITGLLPHRDGAVSFGGRPLGGLPAHRVARLGIGLVPEGRRCFPNLGVEENLVVAARRGPWDLDAVFELFPRLGERRGQACATLSGGEQQMVAIGRALMTNPALLVLDEATEGLAPIARAEIWGALARLRDEGGLSLLVVDRSLAELRRVVDRAVVLERGRVVWEGAVGALDEATAGRLLGV